MTDPVARRRKGPGSPESVLASVVAHLRWRSGLLGALGAACILGGVLLASWAIGGGGWRPGSYVPLVLLVLGGGALLALTFFLVRYLRRWTRETRLAGEVEREAGLPSGALRAQLELDRSPPAGVSTALIAAGAQGLLQRLGEGPARLAGTPGRELRRALRGGTAAAVVLTAILTAALVLAPERARTAWSGLVNPQEILAAGTLPPLSLDPGDVELPRGATPELVVTARGRERVTLHWQEVGAPIREEVLAVDAATASRVLDPLEGRVRYWATSPDGARTAEATITLTETALVTDVTIEVDYPAYTDLPTEIHRGSPSELVVPEGTRLTIRGNVTGGPPTEVRLLGGDDEPLVAFPVEGSSFSGEWSPSTSAEVGWWYGHDTPEYGLPDPFELVVVPDQPPSVALPVPGADADLPANFRLPLVLEASDDHGVAWVELRAVRVGRDGARHDPVVDRMDTDRRRRVILRPMLDLADWGLRPGEEVLLSARAGDASPRGQIGETREYRLRVPSAATMRDLARERIEEGGDRIGSLAERAAADAEDLRRRSQEARMGGADGGDGSMEFQAREELMEAARSQAGLSEELEEVGQSLDDARRSLQGLGEEDGGLRERLRELADLMRELASPEERARMEELLERLAAGEDADAARELEEMAGARSEMAEELEAAFERLQREALEESFAGSEEELRALAEAQAALAERMDAEDAAAAQDSLASAAAEAEGRLEDLGRRLEGRGDTEAAAMTNEALQELREAQEAMERAAAAAEGGDTEGASQAARQADQEASEAFQAMQEARREWMEAWEEGMRDALRRAAGDALSLARRQAEIREPMPARTGEEGLRLRGEEVVLVEAIRGLATRVALETRELGAVRRELGEAFGGALGGVEETVRLLTGTQGERTRASVASERVVDRLNQAALLALAAMDQVGADGEAMGMEELLQALEELAGDQEAVNQEGQSLMAELEMEGAAGRMEEMAASQDAIAGAIEELAQLAGGESMAAMLEELAAEATDLAGELEEGRLESETLQRQEELLDRLLDAGRTLEREGPTEEREGTPAEGVELSVVQPLPEEVLRGGRFPLPTAEELSRLSPAERRMVLEYFERLNRGSDGGGGG